MPGEQHTAGRLTLVPTPVGNLGDMTLRAIDTLRQADFVLAEDTRTSANLLRHFDLHTPLVAYHMRNEHDATPALVRRLLQGERAALVTDAGTPGISDPGYLLARACIDAGVTVDCLPGPTALIPALVSSGLPAERFAFEGFLPTKKGRRTRLEELAHEPRTIIIYESPLRTARTLAELAAALGGQRQASVAREISKLHEETLRGTLAELAAALADTPPRGEIVLCVAGATHASAKTPGDDATHDDTADTQETLRLARRSKHH